VLSEERTKPVKFVLSPGVLKLAAYSADYGEAEEEMEVQYAGEVITIGFNSRYVLDALGAQAGEQIVLEVKDALSPGVLKSLEDDGSLCVIMPMRIEVPGSGDRVHETVELTDFAATEPPFNPVPPQYFNGTQCPGQDESPRGLPSGGRSFRCRAAEMARQRSAA
jgi:hypothetical protein